MVSYRAVLAACVLTAVSASVLADGTATPLIDKREAKQEQRIEQGVASGQLNQREANRMERQESAIQSAEAQAKADGKVTGKERRHLRHMEDRTSRHIYSQKHDAQKQQ
jgi:hypothetical protein